jgi:hypothetical protein
MSANAEPEWFDAEQIERWKSRPYRLGWLENAVETAIGRGPKSMSGIRELRKAYALYEARSRAADAE